MFHLKELLRPLENKDQQNRIEYPLDLLTNSDFMKTGWGAGKPSPALVSVIDNREEEIIVKMLRRRDIKTTISSYKHLCKACEFTTKTDRQAVTKAVGMG